MLSKEDSMAEWIGMNRTKDLTGSGELSNLLDVPW